MTSSDAPSSDAPALRVDDLVAGYGRGPDVVAGVSLTVDAGAVVGIIGPNGAGKSTVLRAVFGLADRRGGRVWLGDDDVTGLGGNELVGRGVAYVPQRRNVFPTLTVDENLRAGAGGRRLGADEIDRILARFPRLDGRRRDRAGVLSGGERQMLALARGLVTSPSVMLLDEPTANLAPTIADEVFRTITALARGGVGVLLVEQNARRCLDIADHAYVLDRGTNAISGSGSSLLSDPQVARLYLGRLSPERSGPDGPGPAT